MSLKSIPLFAAAGESTQNIAYTFIKSYAVVCLDGAMIVFACIIFSSFAGSPLLIDIDASVISILWTYIGEIIFNMLILAVTIKMRDHIAKDMMRL